MPKPTKIIWIIAILIWGLALWLMWKKREQQHQENKVKEWIEFNIIQIENLQTQREELEYRQELIHNKAKQLREENKQLLNELYKEWNEEIMSVICENAPNSPMCWDYKMLTDLKTIAEDNGVEYTLLLGIMYSESHIGSSFAPHYWCRESKNWAWLKWRKYADWTTSEKYYIQYASLDTETQWSLSWCFLYYYEDYTQFFESLTHTIKLGYIDRWWDTPEKIVTSYVWTYSENWVDSVNMFYNLSK